jgi:hypothetical protein
MRKAIGWAEPEIFIGQPRIQKVPGFTYLFAEQQNVHESQAGSYIEGLYGKVQAAYEKLHPGAEKPPRLLMFINVPGQEKMYHVQAGYQVASGTPAAGEAQVREIPPALIAGVVSCGTFDSVWKSYAPLMDFMNKNGLIPLDEGWREYYLYNEGPDSMNNITWIQHLAAEND